MRHLSDYEKRWFHEKKQVRAWWSETDWRASLDDIISERDLFGQDIPFSGDTRAFIERGGFQTVKQVQEANAR